MADAYKVKADTSFPRVLRIVKAADGSDIEETTGQAYAAGDYVLASDLTERNRDRAESGELDHLLEPVDLEEAEQALAAVHESVFIPEHEAERYALLDAGHTVIERDQALELRAAGADAYRDALAASKEGPDDANPAITEQPSFREVPSLVEASNEGKPVVPVESSDPIPEAVIEQQGVEMSPGIPVGPTLAKAEGADPEEVDARTNGDAPQRSAPRPKPGAARRANDDTE